MNPRQAYHSLQTQGVALFPAELYRTRLTQRGVLSALGEVLSSFSKLTPDRHMGDGGTYRNRAYSRFVYTVGKAGPSLLPLAGNSIYQSLADNSVNGGVLRTYEPLSPQIAESEFLRALVFEDAEHAAACDPELMAGPVQVGVHQVRIVARGVTPGLPTPEGIHRDAERFTFQHFCQRQNIEGGEFRAYDEEKRARLSWLQTESLDTVMFEGTTWHSATPIGCIDAEQEGYRDIFLIDFDRLTEDDS